MTLVMAAPRFGSHNVSVIRDQKIDATVLPLLPCVFHLRDIDSKFTISAPSPCKTTFLHFLIDFFLNSYKNLYNKWSLSYKFIIRISLYRKFITLFKSDIRYFTYWFNTFISIEVENLFIKFFYYRSLELKKFLSKKFPSINPYTRSIFPTQRLQIRQSVLRINLSIVWNCSSSRCIGFSILFDEMSACLLLENVVVLLGCSLFSGVFKYCTRV